MGTSALRMLILSTLLASLIATQIQAQEIKWFPGDLGVAIYETIGGGDDVDKFKIELSPFEEYLLILVGLGDGDLDVCVLDPFEREIECGSRSGDVELVLFKVRAFSYVYVEVEVYDGYESSEYFVLQILGSEVRDVDKIE